MNPFINIKSHYFLYFLLLVFACGEKNESAIPVLEIEKVENSFEIKGAILTLISKITLNSKLNEEDKVFYAVPNDNNIGNLNFVSENVVELNISIEEPGKLLSFTPQIERASGLRIKGEPINLSYSEKGDYWLELKRFPIQSNAESTIPFVFGDKVYLAGLGNFHNSTHGISYELDMLSLTLEEKDYMSITTFRKYGFQLGENAYIGECIHQYNGDNIYCSSESITYKYNSIFKKWSQNTDTVNWPVAFEKERHTGFIRNKKAYNYYSYSGDIHVFDEEDNKWSFVSNTIGLAGSPWAEVINTKLYLGSIYSESIKEVDVETGKVVHSYPYPVDKRIEDNSNFDFVHSFTLNEKICIQFSSHSYSSNFCFDTKSKEWSSFAAAPNMNIDFFQYQGSIYKINQGIDHSIESNYFTSIWKYFPN